MHWPARRITRRAGQLPFHFRGCRQHGNRGGSSTVCLKSGARTGCAVTSFSRGFDPPPMAPPERSLYPLLFTCRSSCLRWLNGIVVAWRSCAKELEHCPVGFPYRKAERRTTNEVCLSVQARCAPILPLLRASGCSGLATRRNDGQADRGLHGWHLERPH